MTIDARDRQIVQLVARFRQAAASDIAALVFADTASRTPCDRALRRLTERRYLRRIERRAIGGRRGGSGQYVYQLGPLGHAQFGTGRYIPQRVINYHSLTILEVYRLLVDRARTGDFSIAGYMTEPDCWVTLGRQELKPDLYVELLRAGLRRQLWFEVDMGTQSHGQVRAKFERYWHAYQAAGEDEWPEYRQVIFAAVDAERARELVWLLGQGPAEARAIFTVIPVPELSTASL